MILAKELSENFKKIIEVLLLLNASFNKTLNLISTDII
jgi:hypothetical protein